MGEAAHQWAQSNRPNSTRFSTAITAMKMTMTAMPSIWASRN
jgi:hypothetical protein